MSAWEVQWEEGMFLRPQHFQAEHRQTLQTVRQDEKADHEHNWGLREIKIDLNKLVNFSLEIHSLKARMRDGTYVCVPESGELTPLPLADKLVGEGTVTVYLAVPQFKRREKNSATNPDGGNVSKAPESGKQTGEEQTVGPRYLVTEAEVFDEDNPDNRQNVRVRRLNLCLLSTKPENHERITKGYDILPIAQITKVFKADARPALHPTFIPPLLACDAWKGLEVDLLKGRLHQRVVKLLDYKAKLVISRRLSFEIQSPNDRKLFAQLRALNEADALLQAVLYTRGQHPFTVFVELCRLVGQLVIFSTVAYKMRLPPLPLYNHDDLGHCFFELTKIIETILLEFQDVPYQERPFFRKQLRMEVQMDPDWFKPNWQFFIGVDSSLSKNQCEQLLSPDGLDMKIGSVANVEKIFTKGWPGLKFNPVPNPPSELPQTARNVSNSLTYFQINPDAAPDEWKSVMNSFEMAIRVNERLIAGSTVQGQQRLILQQGKSSTSAAGQADAWMEFTLYVLPKA